MTARRIWIVGPCGSGKSTLAETLAARIGGHAIHLDDLHWLPNWTERPDEEMFSLVEQAVERDAWVIDGNYSRVYARFGHMVDLVVWLDMGRRIVMPRLVRRTFTRIVKRKPCCNGNVETLGRTFSHDSVLLWEIQQNKRRRDRLESLLADKAHVRLRTPREVSAWLDSLPRVAPAEEER